MVHETIFSVLSTHRQIVVIASAVIPVITLLISFTHGVYDGRRGPWRHFYALMAHLTTVAAATVGSLLVYHIVTGGSLERPAFPLVPVIAIGVGWLFTLAFVKRAVDFSMLRTVRNPFGLLLSWILGWAAAAVLAFSGIWLIPGPEYVTVLAAVAAVFLLLRIILRVVFGLREQD
tara:strand:+ start:1015 stop:1539 length:525 start_codon:yes stop_codon:yes gene_type:complete